MSRKNIIIHHSDDCILYTNYIGSDRFLSFSSKYGEKLRCRFPHGFHADVDYTGTKLELTIWDSTGVPLKHYLPVDEIHKPGRIKETLLRFILMVYGKTKGVVDLSTGFCFMEDYFNTDKNTGRLIHYDPNTDSYYVVNPINSTRRTFGISQAGPYRDAVVYVRSIMAQVTDYIVPVTTIIDTLFYQAPDSKCRVVVNGPVCF